MDALVAYFNVTMRRMLFNICLSLDQLKRLTEKHSFKTGDYGMEQTFDFAEDFINDANGNILTANRNASMASAGGQAMDNLCKLPFF